MARLHRSQTDQTEAAFRVLGADRRLPGFESHLSARWQERAASIVNRIPVGALAAALRVICAEPLGSVFPAIVFRLWVRTTAG
jgi:hypothetical protein